MTAVVGKGGRAIFTIGEGRHETIRFDSDGNIIDFVHQDGTTQGPHTTVETKGGKKVRMGWESK